MKNTAAGVKVTPSSGLAAAAGAHQAAASSQGRSSVSRYSYTKCSCWSFLQPAEQQGGVCNVLSQVLLVHGPHALVLLLG